MQTATMDPTEAPIFPQRIRELRKTNGWSQADLAERVGTSAAIIGRYERGDMTPSIEVARRLANAFGVTLDYLCNAGGTPTALQDKTMLARLEALERLNDADRERVLDVFDALIRDCNAKRAYRH